MHIMGINYLSTGAGFLPSTVPNEVWCLGYILGVKKSALRRYDWMSTGLPIADPMGGTGGEPA